MSEFNSSENSWNNLQVVMLGRVVTGFRGLKYKVTREKEFLHAAGNSPRAIQRGRKSIEGEIVLLQSEYNALVRAAKESGGQDITDISLDLAVAFVPSSSQVGPIVNRTVKGVEFTEAEEGMSEGDAFMEITLPFMALDIKTT